MSVQRTAQTSFRIFLQFSGWCQIQLWLFKSRLKMAKEKCIYLCNWVEAAKFSIHYIGYTSNDKSQLFWKRFGDEAEVVQCPFKYHTIHFKMFLHFLVNGQAAAAKYFVKSPSWSFKINYNKIVNDKFWHPSMFTFNNLFTKLLGQRGNYFGGVLSLHSPTYPIKVTF